MTEQENNKQHNDIIRPTKAQIIDYYIMQLLDEPVEEDDEYDPNILDQPMRVYEDNPRFINGIKQTKKPTELKSASRPPMVSEVEGVAYTTDQVCFQVYNIHGKFASVTIPRIPRIFHVKTDELKRWLRNGIDKGEIKVSKDKSWKTIDVKIDWRSLL